MYNVMGLSLEMIVEYWIGTCCEEVDNCVESFKICFIVSQVGFCWVAIAVLCL